MPPTSKSRTTTTRPPALVTGMRSALCLGLLQDWDPRLALPPSGRILLEALQRNAEAFGELMVELPTVNARGNGCSNCSPQSQASARPSSGCPWEATVCY